MMTGVELSLQNLKVKLKKNYKIILKMYFKAILKKYKNIPKN